MGHERVGVLPRTKRWRDVVAEISSYSGSPDETARLARLILKNVRSRFINLHRDDGVSAAFQFLVSLATGTPVASESFDAPVNLEANPSPMRVISTLHSWVDHNLQSTEYATIAKRASADAITLWSRQQSSQPSLLSGDVKSAEIWQAANNGGGFCEVSRLFFYKFTERYLNYYLDREASASLTSPMDRDALDSQLRGHVDHVSRYAFETSKITQSFAAGWFNKYSREGTPTHREVRSFLRIAFGKIHEELVREELRDG